MLRCLARRLTHSCSRAVRGADAEHFSLLAATTVQLTCGCGQCEPSAPLQGAYLSESFKCASTLLLFDTHGFLRWVARRRAFVLQTLHPKVRRKLDAYAPVPRSEWPVVQLLSSLDGHKGDIRSVRFSNGGAAVATACADGSVRLFSPAQDAPRGPAAASSLRPQVVDLDAGPCEWVGTITMVCELRAQQRHHRRPPKAPEVQQVLWSLDDKRVMACVSDMSVRVFDSNDGKQLHVLTGHTKSLYELAAHPWAPDVVATWSYDGTICVHDVESGERLTSFDVRHTYPGRGLWANSEPLCLLDGCWTPSGDALLTTDVAGQFHVFSFGPADLRSRAAYDQFMRCDYDALQRDTAGAVFDIASGRPAHTSGDRRTCTSFMVPYEDPYQSLAAKNRLSEGANLRLSMLLFQ